jgi:uncharacterized protein
MTSLTIPGLALTLVPDGQPPCLHRVADSTLIMTSAPGTDMFVDPAGTGPVPDAGRLLGAPPAGDFSLAARVTVGFRSTFDAGVLLVHAGERRWAKLCFEFSPQHQPMAVTVVTRETSDDCNSFETTSSTLWLRITRTGPAWAFHASADGRAWRLARYFSLGDGTELADGTAVRVGFLAQSPTGQGCTATFDQITLTAGAPADLRDGS